MSNKPLIVDWKDFVDWVGLCRAPIRGRMMYDPDYAR